MSAPLLSVIVPVGPGEMAWRSLVDQLPPDTPSIEVIVSATVPQPEAPDARFTWITGSPGRGHQQNRGAERARGQWLWFVHTDCRLGPDTVAATLDFARCGDQALGYCWLRFLDDGPRLVRLNALGANLRSRLLGLPYGDQTICLPASWFHRLGGFREDLARGEDLDLVVRARRSGLSARPIGATIETSARRYREHGWLNTTVAHQFAAWKLVRNAGRQRPSDRP